MPIIKLHKSPIPNESFFPDAHESVIFSERKAGKKVFCSPKAPWACGQVSEEGISHNEMLRQSCQQTVAGSRFLLCSQLPKTLTTHNVCAHIYTHESVWKHIYLN